jgi:hypothetical protein
VCQRRCRAGTTCPVKRCPWCSRPVNTGQEIRGLSVISLKRTHKCWRRRIRETIWTNYS